MWRFAEGDILNINFNIMCQENQMYSLKLQTSLGAFGMEINQLL